MATSSSSLHPLTLLLLKNRGVTDEQEIQEFLSPSYEKSLGDPFLIHGMKKAVKRILDAIKHNEKIVIYSDYDCDGIPGGVLLRTFFDDIGYPVGIYIPHRHNEGYGLHTHALDSLQKQGVSLIITVDLAITNIEEVAYAKKQGIDIIVTDHHLPIHEEGNGQVVPSAVAVLNSKQEVCTYPDDMLCGCAVAWKLACALLFQLKEDGEKGRRDKASEAYATVLDTVSLLKDGYEKWLLDLVGISTVADMVPLVKENRALAYFGLKVLRQTKRPGLQHIFLEQGIAREHLTEDDIAFTIAPRINAASRMGEPIQAHRMLYANNRNEAEKLVEELEALNTERKLGVKDITDGISFDHEHYKNDVVVVGNLMWGPGILGLIAQKIIDETGKPTFVWGQGDDKTTVKGSCRSRGDVHVVELMARVQELFPGIILHAGGHEQAGGFSCAGDKVSQLESALNEAFKHVEVKEKTSSEKKVDTNLTFDDLSPLTYEAIEVLAPFGVANEKPLFAFTGSKAVSVRWFGKKGEHLEVMYPKTNGTVKAIMFFAPKALEEKLKETHTLQAHFEKSVFRGKKELRLRIQSVL